MKKSAPTTIETAAREKPQQNIPWLSDWKERLYAWLTLHLGQSAAWLAVVLLVGGLPFLWTNWNTIREWPGVNRVDEYVKQPGLPKARPGEYSVVIASLDGDPDGRHEKIIEQSLAELPAVHVYKLGRRIGISGADIRVAEAQAARRAQEYLEETEAQILLWGQVVPDDKGGVPKLRWTVSANTAPAKQHERYQAGGNNELPPLFWEDLYDVLRLLVVDGAATFETREGHYIADQLYPFIAKVRPLLEEKSGRTNEWKPEAAVTVRFILANALVTFGEQRGDSGALAEAIAAYQAALKEFKRERLPLDWAVTQNNLGNALAMLGEREGNAARLEQAVTSYQEALKEYTRERAPLDWAMTQNNLGTALWILSERDGSTARLEQAVAAYQEALKEYTRERTPLGWARTQNNLGNALARLGEQEDGTVRLEQAVTAYRDALKERRRERAPLQWAKTQNNLGNVLAKLGEREESTARLEQAMAAYREALKEHRRERVPLDWAQTQCNLGAVLWRLGEREPGTTRLQQAVAAYQEALKEYTREHVPLQWAMTQNNLGIALWSLGERERNTTYLTSAMNALEAARNVYQRSGVTRHEAHIENTLQLLRLRVEQLKVIR